MQRCARGRVQPGKHGRRGHLSHHVGQDLGDPVLDTVALEGAERPGQRAMRLSGLDDRA